MCKRRLPAYSYSRLTAPLHLLLLVRCVQRPLQVEVLAPAFVGVRMAAAHWPDQASTLHARVASRRRDRSSQPPRVVCRGLLL